MEQRQNREKYKRIFLTETIQTFSSSSSSSILPPPRVCVFMAMENSSTPFSSSLSLEEIRQIQSKFASERDWDQYHSPRNLLLAMVGEVGELSELFQWRGEVSKGLPGWPEAEREHLGQELSDVLIYLVRLAEQCHVDLPAAVLDKFKLNAQKYPPGKAGLKYSNGEGKKASS